VAGSRLLSAAAIDRCARAGRVHRGVQKAARASPGHVSPPSTCTVVTLLVVVSGRVVVVVIRHRAIGRLVRDEMTYRLKVVSSLTNPVVHRHNPAAQAYTSPMTPFKVQRILSMIDSIRVSLTPAQIGESLSARGLRANASGAVS
jgi:hypothetical protein